MRVVRPKRPTALPTFILQHGKPTLEPDKQTWQKWMADHTVERVLVQTRLDELGMLVVTQFVGVDVVVRDQPRPYRTEVQGGQGEGMKAFYLTAAAAREGHERVVALCRDTYGEAGQKRLAELREDRERRRREQDPKPRTFPKTRRSPYA